VSEPQPWRNPRRAPDLAELRAKLATPRWLVWLWAWWPAIAWAGVIFSLSTDTFSSEHTGSILEPILRRIVPGMSAELFNSIHNFIRKSAHFAEYFVFCLLLYRGVRGARKGWRWTWGVAALGGAAGYSILDEIHQAFVASRTASAYDSVLDSTGAFVAFAVLWMWFRLRRLRGEAEAAADKAPAG
jgi:VanZ family protein